MDNPFFLPSTLPYQLPDFARITESDYEPAFEEGMREHLIEVASITNNPETPTFENTIVALERSGQILSRVSHVFFNKTSSDTSEVLEALQAKIAPLLSAHRDSIQLNQELFKRIQNLWNDRVSLELGAEELQVLKKYYEDFVHAGALLNDEQRERVKSLNQELASLQAQFSQRVLADSNDLAVAIEDVSLLSGLSDAQIAACKQAAVDKGIPDAWVIPVVNFSGHPFLQSLSNRETRKRVMEASLKKGLQGNSNDTREILVSMAKLRAKKAKLFGFGSHAEYVLSRQTAKHPDRVVEMLSKLAKAAVRNAKSEATELQAIINSEPESFSLASWDWDYYTEILRREKYSLDVSLLKPYFELNNVLYKGIFKAAGDLYGLSFRAREDLVAYHPDAKVFEVFKDDAPLGLYIADFYARSSKRGGAWMNSLVDQNTLLDQSPVIVNNLNIPKPPEGSVTLLTLDETTTFFHEFGHALHGLLSNVTYPRVSGTSVERDFVEFPSQVNEMWMMWPEVVDEYARHYETGERLPQEWIDTLQTTETFNEGYKTTSYLAASVLDLAFHLLHEETEIDDVEQFERDAIAAYGLDFEPVPTRYRSTYFSHIFAGGYSAGYYGYIWSEVLDADAVEWFKEHGGLTRKNGQHFADTLLSRGGSIDSMEMFRNFRGRDAELAHLLKRRGLN
jgi:peptidyl-dipeptidase Dcp